MVVAIISALAVAVFVALNPAKRLKDAQDARRTADVDAILSAIHQSIVDNKGLYPVSMPPTDVWRQLGAASTGCTLSTTFCTGATAVTDGTCANLMANGRNLEPYLAALPVDPLGVTYTASGSGYAVMVNSNGIVTIRACAAQGSADIYSSR